MITKIIMIKIMIIKDIIFHIIIIFIIIIKSTINHFPVPLAGPDTAIPTIGNVLHRRNNGKAVFAIFV